MADFSLSLPFCLGAVAGVGCSSCSPPVTEEQPTLTVFAVLGRLGGPLVSFAAVVPTWLWGKFIVGDPTVENPSTMFH